MAKYLGRNRIRKVGALLCVLCVMVTLLTGTQSVYAAGGAKLTVSTQQAQPGQNVAVTVTLSDNAGVWGLRCRVGYDHSDLKLTSVVNGSIFAEKEVSYSQSLDKDPFVYVAFAEKLEDIRAEGTMVTLNFQVTDEAASGEYPITLEVTQAIDATGVEIPVVVRNGAVRVYNWNSDQTCTHNVVWKVTKEATCETAGIEYAVCSRCGSNLGTRTIEATGHLHKKVKNVRPATDTDRGYTGDTYCKDCGKLISKGRAIAALRDTNTKLCLRIPESTDTTNVLKWKKVTDADGYVIYGGPSGTKAVKLAVIRKGSTITWTGKDLEPGMGYKYCIRAYKLVNGRKIWLAKSGVIYAVTTGGEYGNAKSVKLNKTSVELETEKTFAIVAEQIPEDLPIKHPASFKYCSNNNKVATVSNKGVITAKKAGTCYIYVCAQNGVYRKIKVTVQ